MQSNMLTVEIKEVQVKISTSCRRVVHCYAIVFAFLYYYPV